MNTKRVVGLVTENSPDFIQKIFALWSEGAVVVPLRSADDHFRRDASQATEVQSAAPGFGWLRKGWAGHHEDAAAQILFTSGTEGEPKSVLLTHRNLADTVERLNAVMHTTADIREYVGVPVHHSFGFARCRAVLAAGGQAFIPSRGFNPVEINTMLENGDINAISAVPSLWRVLLQSEAISATAAARVRWIEIGSQHMAGAEKRALRELFSKAVIVQHYGLTEASRSTFLEVHRASPAELESVGRATGAVEISITPDGRIATRGPHVATQITDKGVATDPRDAQGWFSTNDLGRIQDGYLYYEGRADDVINCGGLKLSPDELERAMAALLPNTAGSADIAVCRVPDAVRGDGILLVASHSVQASDAELLQAALQACAQHGVSARDATHVMRVATLERTDNGKVRRQNLARAFLATRPAAGAGAVAAPANASTLRARLGVILGVPEVADQDTFVNLGGDSLRYIQASVALEKQLGYLPEAWEKRPIAELEALQPLHSRSSQIEPSVILRAIAIVSVVMNHAGVFKNYFAIDGAAFMLLLPAGYSFARFQLQRVIDSGLARMALVALPRIIVPTVLLLAMQQIKHREFQPSALFLYHNYLNTPDVFSLWFIEVFVQLHLLLALLLCLPGVRGALKRQPWGASMVALVGSALVSLLAPLVWDTDPLYNLVPHKVMWYFFMGWCLLFAQTSWQRWANAACIATIAVVLSNAQLPPDSQSLWILFGGLFLNWAPTFKLPTALVRVISAIASASLYIYISHFLVQEPAGKLFPAIGALGKTAVAVAVGIVFWYCFERAWQFAARRLQRQASA